MVQNDRQSQGRWLGWALLVGLCAVVLTELTIRMDLVPILMLVPAVGWLTFTAMVTAVMILGMVLLRRRPRFASRTVLLLVLLIAGVAGRLNHEITFERRRARAQQSSFEQLLLLKPTTVTLTGRYTDGQDDYAIQEWLASVVFVLANPNVLPHEICYASQVDLSGSTIVDANLPTLVGLGRIDRLDLSRTSVTDDGLNHLTALNWLGEIRVTGTTVSKEGLKGLRERFPDLQCVP